MAGDYQGRVHRVMDHVRSHLADDLSLEALAKVAAFSPHHFHRIFKATTGELLTGFVQRCRLERAAYLMKANPDRPLGSIALEVGFSAQSDFSRVFRKHYGVAPSDWDRKSRLDGQQVTSDYEAVLAAAKAEWPSPEVRVVDHEAARLAYVRVRAPFIGPQLREGYEQLVQWLRARDVRWREAPLMGLSWDNYETTPIDRVCFDFGFVVDESIHGEGAVGIHELPAHASADIHVQGGLPRIAVAWDYLYEEWLPRSGREPLDLPGLKRFRALPDEGGWERWDVDCCVPLRSSQDR